MTVRDRCYRCGQPATIGRRLCSRCTTEVDEARNKPPSYPVCSCGHAFINDHERIQHELVERHHYRAFRPDTARPPAQTSQEPTVTGREQQPQPRA